MDALTGWAPAAGRRYWRHLIVALLALLALGPFAARSAADTSPVGDTATLTGDPATTPPGTTDPTVVVTPPDGDTTTPPPVDGSGDTTTPPPTDPGDTTTTPPPTDGGGDTTTPPPTDGGDTSTPPPTTIEVAPPPTDGGGDSSNAGSGDGLLGLGGNDATPTDSPPGDSGTSSSQPSGGGGASSPSSPAPATSSPSAPVRVAPTGAAAPLAGTTPVTTTAPAAPLTVVAHAGGPAARHGRPAGPAHTDAAVLFGVAPATVDPLDPFSAVLTANGRPVLASLPATYGAPTMASVSASASTIAPRHPGAGGGGSGPGGPSGPSGPPSAPPAGPSASAGAGGGFGGVGGHLLAIAATLFAALALSGLRSFVPVSAFGQGTSHPAHTRGRAPPALQ